MSSYFGWELDKGDDTIATMLINGRLVYRGPATSVSSLYDEILAHFQIGEDAAAERISSLESQLAEAKARTAEILATGEEFDKTARAEMASLVGQLQDARSKLEQAERERDAYKHSVSTLEKAMEGREEWWSGVVNQYGLNHLAVSKERDEAQAKLERCVEALERHYRAVRAVDGWVSFSSGCPPERCDEYYEAQRACRPVLAACRKEDK